MSIEWEIRLDFASGSGRIWKCITWLVVPRPVSMWNGVRVLMVAHRPRPFHPAFASSMRPSIHFVIDGVLAETQTENPHTCLRRQTYRMGPHGRQCPSSSSPADSAASSQSVTLTSRDRPTTP